MEAEGRGESKGGEKWGGGEREEEGGRGERRVE